ncbi:MAG: hypothetical protein NT157_03760 [Candidatus Micrarchaeota archaeon]|nr:hypothetical protein [Candidatus Micrarchaeota archaeon]
MADEFDEQISGVVRFMVMPPIPERLIGDKPRVLDLRLNPDFVIEFIHYNPESKEVRELLAPLFVKDRSRYYPDAVKMLGRVLNGEAGLDALTWVVKSIVPEILEKTEVSAVVLRSMESKGREPILAAWGEYILARREHTGKIVAWLKENEKHMTSDTKEAARVVASRLVAGEFGKPGRAREDLTTITLSLLRRAGQTDRGTDVGERLVRRMNNRRQVLRPACGP